jgi:hypothetical protein
MTRLIRALAVAFVVLLLVPGPAGAVVRGEPHVTVGLADDRLTQGESATLSVVVVNDADLEQASLTNPSLNVRVTTARAVEVSVASAGPVRVRGGTQLIGSLADGASASLPFDTSLTEDARPGTYELPVEVRYTYTPRVSETVGAAERRTVTVHRTVEVRVEAAPRFAVVGVDGDVRAGESGRVAVTVENVGSAAATDARFTLRSLDGALSTGEAGGTRPVERWEPGETRTLAYTVRAAADALAGPYALSLAPTYRDRGETVEADPLLVSVPVASDSRFSVVGVGSSAVAEGTGSVEVTLRNEGGAVSGASVSLASPTTALRVDGGAASSRFVGEWGAGETRTVGYNLVADEGTAAGTYAFTARVTRRDGAGTVESGPVSVGVPLAGAPEFGVEGVEADLHVGERGTVRGRVVNEGNATAWDAVVVLESRSPHVTVPEAAVSVGDVGPGESAAFDAGVDVSPDGVPGERPFSLTVEYGTASGERRTSDVVTFRGSVGPDREPFAVEPVNATFAPDASGALVVRVTNTGETPRERISLRIAPEIPFTSVSPETYVDRLEPGASAEVVFELTVDEDAVESTHAVALNLTSEVDGERAVRDEYLLSVRVTEESAGPVDTATAVAAVVLAVALAVGVGYWWYRRN